MGLASFSIDVDELGHGRIELNGVDVADRVAELQVRTRPGEPTVVVVRQVVGSSQIDGEGIVQVLAAADRGDLDESAVIAEWLDNLDGDLLEQQVLASFSSLAPPATNGEAWLTVLRKLARP